MFNDEMKIHFRISFPPNLSFLRYGLDVKASTFHLKAYSFRGKIHYTDVFNMLRQIDPPLGFGKKCPERMAYKKLIRMNMPMDKEGKVSIS